MKGRFLSLMLLSLSGCVAVQPMTAPPTHDPEGCDRDIESVKRTESDLVADGVLYCATDDGDCELSVAKVITSQSFTRTSGEKIPIHILRKEADAYSRELEKRDEIAYCYPPELWFPDKGHYLGRFYLRKEKDGRYQMAFYPRVSKEY